MDRGERPGVTTEMTEKMKALERENRELKQANEILRKGETIFRHWSEELPVVAPLVRAPLATVERIFCSGGARPPVQDMIAFIEENRDIGGEPICKHLPIAPSTFYDHMARRANPDLLSDRARRDKALRPEIERVWVQNDKVYGVRKVWHQLGRAGVDVARCTVARLMKEMGIQGIIRGKPHKKVPCPLDTVNRQFRVPAPNMLWVSDFTYVATWKGFVYVAFVIDAYARRIVGWRVSKSPHAGFVLDALEQAVHERRPTKGMGLVHHSDRGSQYLSIKYTERLAEAGIEPSVGSVGDSYDNALAETINGLFKAEVKVLTKEPGTENGVVGAPPSHSTWTSTRAQVLAENVRINVTRHCPPAAP
jgi:transposase InsO family protein